jgi:hypothetical protein
MKTKRDDLIDAYAEWFINGSFGLNALTWAAVAELRERLPPAGPDEVEIEVQALFPEEA